jgi:hypothetical protein
MRVRQAWSRILDLEGYRVMHVGFKGGVEFPRLQIDIERRGVRHLDSAAVIERRGESVMRSWDDLPWSGNRVTLRYRLRRLLCRQCGIRTERVGFADPKARVTRRLRQQFALYPRIGFWCVIGAKKSSRWSGGEF